MRIIQIIDSLDAGGAERMAVSFANALANEIEFSALVATRKEGNLRNQINDNVPYLFLNKKRTIDFIALNILRNYVRKNKIEIVHAHGTSFFFAFLLKLVNPRTKLIWHDHYGDTEFLATRPSYVLKLAVPFFKGVIAVNQNLKKWSEKKLKAKNVIYLPNFPVKEKNIIEQTKLKGIEGKRIVSLANLRAQKNHVLMIEIAKKLRQSHQEWSFHLVGKDFEDGYSNQIKELIIQNHLEENVFLYGSKQEISTILTQADIAILTSQSEGLPVALLEYGLNQKAVVVTNVGEMPTIVQNQKNGFIVESNNVDMFYNAIKELIENKTLRSEYGKALYNTIQTDYTVESVLKKYLEWLKKE